MRKLYLIIFGLLLYTNGMAQNGWVAYSIPAPGGGNFAFADVNTGIVIGQHKYFLSTNSGVSWTMHHTPDTAATSSYGGIFLLDAFTGWITGGSAAGPIPYFFMNKTTNSGQTFGPAVQILAPNDMQFLNSSLGFMASGYIDIFISTGAIQKTTNGGNNWESIFFDNFANQDVSFINQQTGWVYGYYADDIGTFVHRIMRTNNGGENWSILFLDSTYNGYSPYRGMQFFDNNTGYLMNKKIYKSTNGGSNWALLDTNVFSGNFIRNFFFLNKDTGWVTTGPTGKIFRTDNGGTNWTTQNTTVSAVNGKIYFIDAQTGWAIANNTTILKTTTGGVTSIQPISSEVPGSFLLHKNYPNPFNPETKIKFEIPKQGFVSLKVYDISGREVIALFNGELAPGIYEYNFSSAGLGSGVYFYKLQSGDFVETRRMVLIK